MKLEYLQTQDILLSLQTEGRRMTGKGSGLVMGKDDDN